MTKIYSIFRRTENGLKETLLPSTIQQSSMCVSSKHQELVVKSMVSAVFILPFVLSSVDMIKRYPIGGVIFSIIANSFIARLAWVFYARHFIEMFDEQEELEHIQSHLRPRSHDISPMRPWSMQHKALVLVGVLTLTLPLGLTKIGLNDKFDPVWTTLKLIYLVAYAAVEAAPHINHLQLQSQAMSKYLELSWMTKLWIVTLMVGHALSDSADIWNAKGFWFYWVCAALFIEFYLSNVEAVAHQQPHIPEVTMISMTKLMILFLGSMSMAIFNWHNTFKDAEISAQNGSKIIFIALQMVNAIFVTFEAWHHEAEAIPHGDDDNTETTSHAQHATCQAGANCRSHQHSMMFCAPVSASVSTKRADIPLANMVGNS